MILYMFLTFYSWLIYHDMKQKRLKMSSKNNNIYYNFHMSWLILPGEDILDDAVFLHSHFFLSFFWPIIFLFNIFKPFHRMIQYRKSLTWHSTNSCVVKYIFLICHKYFSYNDCSRLSNDMAVYLASCFRFIFLYLMWILFFLTIDASYIYIIFLSC